MGNRRNFKDLYPEELPPLFQPCRTYRCTLVTYAFKDKNTKEGYYTKDHLVVLSDSARRRYFEKYNETPIWGQILQMKDMTFTKKFIAENPNLKLPIFDCEIYEALHPVDPKDYV